MGQRYYFGEQTGKARVGEVAPVAEEVAAAEVVIAAAAAIALVGPLEGLPVVPAALWQEARRVGLRVTQCVGRWKMVSGKGE